MDLNEYLGTHSVEILAFALAVVTYSWDRRKERRLQDEKHAANQTRLDAMIEFMRDQGELNKKRDEQITQLMAQTSALAELARGHGRRLEMLEDRRKG